MKRTRRTGAAAVLLIALATTIPVGAGECPDWSGKRAAMDVCRVVRATFGHAAYRACVAWAKAAEKECGR